MNLVNWVDVAIVAVVLTGAWLGAQRGILRQAALIGAFYASLVFAARYYGLASGYVVAYVPQADRSVAAAYALAGITVVGTLGLTYLSHIVYSSTTLPRLALLDHLAGAGLGVAWSWAVVAFAVTVLAFGLTLSWGASDPLRREVGAQIDRSRIVALARATEPRLYELVRPWLPGGLPSVLAS